MGRPNVGKSALFNRLVRARTSIVHDTPGGHVTRDYQESPARLGDLRFLAIDTSGLEPFSPTGTIQWRATALTTKVLCRSDVVVLMLDGKTGVLPMDYELLRWLHRAESGRISDKIVLVANKCEIKGSDGASNAAAMLSEAMPLGLGEPIAISAETGEGLVDLYSSLAERLDPILRARREAIEEIERTSIVDQRDVDRSEEEKTGASDLSKVATKDDTSKPVKIAIMGLVNVVRGLSSSSSSSSELYIYTQNSLTLYIIFTKNKQQHVHCHQNEENYKYNSKQE